MSTSPTESAFGTRRSSDPHRDAASSDTANQAFATAADDPEAPRTDVEWTNTELHSIASTIEELQRRLEVANTRLSSAATIETTELEIGRLFVEAQRFSEESLSKLEFQIHEILCAAEAKGKQILVEATEDALEIRRQAQEAAFASTTTARELQAAIVGFTTVNNGLVKELGALNSMLAPVEERGVIEIDRSSEAPEHD